MTKYLVIAIDAQERALDALALGRALTESIGAQAKLVTVFTHLPFADPAAPEMVRDREAARETLSELAGAVGLGDAALEVVAGTVAARELQRITEQEDTGAIVVGSTTRGPIGRLLIGGVGERLLAGAACPVAVAPRGYGDASPSALTRIGVGVDGSEEARRALEAAVALVERAGGELVVITAVQRLAFGGVTTTALASTSANDAMERGLRTIHGDALANAAKTVKATGRFVAGSADEVLLAQSADLDLLVVGSRGYGPLGAVLMGSATTALSRGAACPVLVMPRGTRLGLLS